MNRLYLIVGAFTFWATASIATGLAIGAGIVGACEWFDRHTRRPRVGSVVDPFTEAQTDRLVRQWRVQS